MATKKHHVRASREDFLYLSRVGNSEGGDSATDGLEVVCRRDRHAEEQAAQFDEKIAALEKERTGLKHQISQGSTASL